MKISTNKVSYRYSTGNGSPTFITQNNFCYQNKSQNKALWLSRINVKKGGKILTRNNYEERHPLDGFIPRGRFSATADNNGERWKQHKNSKSSRDHKANDNWIGTCKIQQNSCEVKAEFPYFLISLSLHSSLIGFLFFKLSSLPKRKFFSIS